MVWMVAALLMTAAVFSCSSATKILGLKKNYLDPDMAARRNMDELKPLLKLSEQQKKDLYDLHRHYYKSMLTDLKDYDDHDIDGHELESRSRLLGFKTVRKAQGILTPGQLPKYRQWAKREGIIK